MWEYISLGLGSLLLGLLVGKLISDFYWKKYLDIFFESNVAIPLTEINKIKAQMFNKESN